MRGKQIRANNKIKYSLEYDIIYLIKIENNLIKVI